MNRVFAIFAALLASFEVTGNRLRIYAEGEPNLSTLDGLRTRMLDLHTGMTAIQARADAEGREMTSEETAQITAYLDEFERHDANVKRREALAAVGTRLSTGTGRTTDPGAVTDSAPGVGAPLSGGTRAAVDANGGLGGRAPITTRPVAEGATNGGFRHFGEFALSVRTAGQKGGSAIIDPRLTALNAVEQRAIASIRNAAPTTMRESVGSDGGFAIPPDFRAAILEKVLSDTSLYGRTDQLTSSSNTMTFPKDETTPWQSSGGIQATWEGEAVQHSPSGLKLSTTTLRLNKLTAMVNVTDELMEDAPALGGYIQRKAPAKIDFKITDAIINGNGVGMPMGILNGPAKVTQAKESGQSAQTIVFNNIAKMWARMYAGCRANAVWLINQDIEPQLFGLQFPGSGTAVPVYLPPGGLSASPYGTLMGRPVIPLESCQTLGTEGDIILTDLRQYMTIRKIAGLMRQDVSIHLYFDYDVTAFKFVVRIGGAPWWDAAIDRKNGSNTLSCTVTLATR